MQAELQALQNQLAELTSYKIKAKNAAEDSRAHIATLSHQIINLRVELAAIKVTNKSKNCRAVWLFQASKEKLKAIS